MNHIFYNGKSDPTGIFDWLTFSLCVFVTIIQSISMLVYLIKRRHYTPLRTKNFTYLYLCHIFGLIMIFSTFISNNHITEWNVIKNDSNCVVWSFWLEYFFGFALFYFFLVQHIGGIAFLGSNDSIRYCMRLFIFMFSIVPPLIMFSWITHTNACFYSLEYNSCTTKLHWKFALLAWLFMCLILMCMLIFILYKNELIKDEKISEYKALIYISIVITIILFINAPLNIFGFLSFEWGRCIYTLNILFLHVFIHMKLISYRLYKSIRNDREYVSEIMNSSEVINIDVNTIVDLEHNDEKMQKFLTYIIENSDRLIVKNKYPLSSSNSILSTFKKNTGESKSYEILSSNEHIPLNYVNAYNQLNRLIKLIIEWKEQDLCDDVSSFKNLIEHFHSHYLKEQSIFAIAISDKRLVDSLIQALKNTSLLDISMLILLKKDIINTMDIYWGKDYLKFDNIQIDKYVYQKQKNNKSEEHISGISNDPLELKENKSMDKDL